MKHCVDWVCFFIAEGNSSDLVVIFQFLLSLQDTVKTYPLPVIGHGQTFSHQANVRLVILSI